MASGTITGKTSNEYIDVRIVWSSTPTTDTNTSKVTASLQYKRNNTGYTTYGTGSFSLSIAGSKATATKTVTITENAWVTVLTSTRTVEHNDDGSLSIKIAGTGSIGGTSLESTSCSDTVDLDTIPRASDFSIFTGYTTSGGVPYVTVNGENTLKVNISRHSASFTHRVRMYYGSTLVSTFNGVGAAVTITMTLSKWAPHMKSRKNTVALSTANAPSVDVTTYNADGKQIGDITSRRFDIYIPDIAEVRPDLSMTLSPVTSLPSPFDKMYLQGYSRVDVNFTSEAKYEADISSHRMTVLGKNYSSPYTSDYLSKSGSIKVSGKVTDSRGFSTTVSKNITVLAYEKPYIARHSDGTRIICERCVSDGRLWHEGKFIKVKCAKAYTKLYSGSTLINKCMLRYRIKESDKADSTYSAWVTLLGKDSSTTDYDAVIPSLTVEKNIGYTIQLSVIDDVGESTMIKYDIGTGTVTMHLAKGGGGVGVGMYSSGEGFEVGFDTNFYGDVSGRVLGLGKLPEIPKNSDLNDYMSIGAYAISSNVVAETIANIPLKKAGTLRVFSGTGQGATEGDWVYLIQDYIDHSGRYRYSRNINTSGTAGQWEYGNWISCGACATTYILASSTSGDWKYLKYSNGTYDMWGIFEVTATTSTAQGSLFYTEQFEITTPFAIKNAIVAGTSLSYGWLTNGGFSGNNKVIFRVLSAVGTKDKTFNVRLRVSGFYE